MQKIRSTWQGGEEIAVGEYPVEAVRVADITIREAEKVYPFYKDLPANDRTQAIASSASKLLESLDSKPIVITSTGRAAIQLSRFRPDKDIIVFGHDELVLRQLALTWGVAVSPFFLRGPHLLGAINLSQLRMARRLLGI